MKRERGDSAEAMRIRPPGFPPGSLFESAAATAEPPHEWALRALRRNIRDTAEAMAVFSADDVRLRCSPALQSCLELVPDLFGQAMVQAAKANEIRLRDDLPSVVSQRESSKGRRLSQWSKL